MKLKTRLLLNQLKNCSLKGVSHVHGILVDTFTLDILKCLYREGLLQSFHIYNKNDNKHFFFVDVHFRVVNGFSLLKSIKIFNSKNSCIRVKTLDRLTLKQTIFLVSTLKGIKTSFNLKKSRLGGTLLLSC